VLKNLFGGSAQFLFVKLIFTLQRFHLLFDGVHVSAKLPKNFFQLNVGITLVRTNQEAFLLYIFNQSLC
jgi:hypothetical protein